MKRRLSQMARPLAQYGWTALLLLLLSCDGGTRGSGIGTGFSTLTGSIAATDEITAALFGSGAALSTPAVTVEVREAPGVRAEVNPVTRSFTLSEVPPGDVTLDFSGDVDASLKLYGLPEEVSLHLVNVRFEGNVAKAAGFAITANEGRDASIETTRRKGSAPLDVNFNVADLVVPAPAQVLWSFGDGTRSGQQSTRHAYTHAGNYVVEAEVSGGNETQRAFQVIQVTEPGERTLEVTAHATPDRGLPTLNVQFSAEAENAIGTVTYLWDFGDVSPMAEGAEVGLGFTEEGLFLVQLTAFDEGGGEARDVVQIQVNDGTRPVPLSVEASVASTSTPVGNAPHRVKFVATITSPGLIRILWDFNDQGITSTEPSPEHTFVQPGTYFVTVFVTDIATEKMVSDQVTIEVH